MVEYWILIFVCVLLLVVNILQFLFFFRNTKQAKAKIVTDKPSIYCICVVAFLFIGYLANFIMEGYKISPAQISSLICGVVFTSFALNMLLYQNIFAYSQDVLLIGYKKYNMEQFQVKSIKKGFNDRMLIKAINAEYNHNENGITLRLSESNYQKYRLLFQEKVVY